MTEHRAHQSARPVGRGVLSAIASAMCWVALCHGAHASDCAGSYSASLIHKLPSPNVVLLDPESGGDVPAELADRFVTGLHRAGVVTAGQPTTRLDVVTMVVPSAGMVSRHPGSYHGFGWATDMSPTADSVVSSTLQVSLTLTNVKTAEINWIASLSCKILTNNKARIVEMIGEILGRAVGKEVNPRDF